MNSCMHQIIVRTLRKNKLSVVICLANQTKRFERLNSEKIGTFIKRLRNKLNGVESVQLLDNLGKMVDNDQPLFKALISSNIMSVNDTIFSIILDPPSIDSISLYSTVPCSGFVLSAKVKLTDLEMKLVQYKWEKCCLNGEWIVISTSPTLFVSKELVGCQIRLGCHSNGVPMMYSEEVGPVIKDGNVNILLERAVPISFNSTRVMDYNILADCFMQSKVAPITNFFPYCPREFQARSYREPRIVAEVHAHDPQILCLQENLQLTEIKIPEILTFKLGDKELIAVEDKTFKDSLVPALTNYLGYITVMKGRSKSGCAIFYKASNFQEELYESFALPDLYKKDSPLTDLVDLGAKMSVTFPDTMRDIRIRPVMTQIIVLRCRHSDGIIIVGNTHLYWNPLYHVIALLHVHAMCSKMAQLRDVYQEKDVRVSVVVCGDLNSKGDSLVHQYLTKQSFNQETGPLCEFLSLNVANPLTLQLARGDPHYTNYTADFKDVIDYILCDSQSTVAQVTPSPLLEHLEKAKGCPSAIFPSDHLPIISDIMFGNKS